MMYRCYIHPNNPISVFFYLLKSSFVWHSSKHSLSTHSPSSPGHPLYIQVVFTSLPLLVFFPLALQTLHISTLDFASFHSAGVSLLSGQWFLPVNLAMLSIAGVLSSNLGALQKRCVQHPTNSTEKHLFLLLICTVYVMRVHTA